MKGNGHVLSFDEALQKADLKRTLVECPLLGGSIYVRTMTAKERSDFEADLISLPNEKERTRNFREQLLPKVLETEDQQPFIPKGRVGEFMQLPADAIEEVFEQACVLNGFSKKDVETLEKNS